jgi:hypothetical protein
MATLRFSLTIRKMVIKDRTKGETQLIANPSYPRSALSLHFAM